MVWAPCCWLKDRSFHRRCIPAVMLCDGGAIALVVHTACAERSMQRSRSLRCQRRLELNVDVRFGVEAMVALVLATDGSRP